MIENFGNLLRNLSVPDFQIPNKIEEPVYIPEDIKNLPDEKLTKLKIEELTLQIFVDLLSAIDGCKRQMRMVGNNYDQEDKKRAKKELQQLTPTPQSIRIGHLIYHLLSAIGYIFLGYEFFNNKLSLNESIALYARSATTWKTKINGHYGGNTRVKLQILLDKTNDLLSSRRSFSIYMSYERYTLYALAILAAIGAKVQKQRYVVIGLAGSAITLLFMLIHYGANALIQSSANTNLIKQVKEAYAEVS